MFVQYIRIQNGFFLVIFLVISIGCAESDRSNHFEKLEGNEQEIIFGTRSNENIAHIAWEAETASPGIQYNNGNKSRQPEIVLIFGVNCRLRELEQWSLHRQDNI